MQHLMDFALRYIQLNQPNFWTVTYGERKSFHLNAESSAYGDTTEAQNQLVPNRNSNRIFCLFNALVINNRSCVIYVNGGQK
jgi:hypothetical protein